MPIIPRVTAALPALGRAAEHFTMVVFSRGLHCPIRRRYLTELDGMADEFGRRGVGLIVASSDRREPRLFLVRPDGTL